MLSLLSCGDIRSIPSLDLVRYLFDHNRLWKTHGKHRQFSALSCIIDHHRKDCCSLLRRREDIRHSFILGRSTSSSVHGWQDQRSNIDYRSTSKRFIQSVREETSSTQQDPLSSNRSQLWYGRDVQSARRTRDEQAAVRRKTTDVRSSTTNTGESSKFFQRTSRTTSQSIDEKSKLGEKPRTTEIDQQWITTGQHASVHLER